MKKDFRGLLIISVLCFISLISVISFVSGLGISSSYHSKNPLIMAPGESMDIIFGRFQNVVGDYDMVVGVELLGGGEIAEITDSSLEYSVPLGRKDIAVNMRVSIPNRNSTVFQIRSLLSLSARPKSKFEQIVVPKRAIEELPLTSTPANGMAVPPTLSFVSS